MTLRLFAAARAAAGAGEVHVLAGPLEQVLAQLREAHPPRLVEVLSISSLVCDGVRLDPADPAPIPAGSVVDVLPPFAGG